MNPAYAPPGTGWPEDPARPDTPVAGTGAEVAALAAAAPDLAELTARQSVCRACPRLVEWREQVAVERRRAFATEAYWGRPIAGWGDPHPRLVLVGLAPAAHGGNRTGRVFTGDRSGDFLFAALHRTGWAALPTSVRAGDGQRLRNARMAAAVRCAPPANSPTPAERDACRPWLAREIAFLLPEPAGRAGARWVRRGGRAGLAGRQWRPVVPHPLPEIRARRRGRTGRSGRAALAAGLLPPQPAEHVHRPVDRAHARRCADPGP